MYGWFRFQGEGMKPLWSDPSGGRVGHQLAMMRYNMPQGLELQIGRVAGRFACELGEQALELASLRVMQQRGVG